MSQREEGGGDMRTTKIAKKHERNKNTLDEIDVYYQKDIVTTSQYCHCRDCLKYCNYKKPVQCIDPFLMDMKHTYWIYDGLVMASKSERAISKPVPDNTHDNSHGKE